MTNQHPITPPPELVEQWREKWSGACGPFAVYLATQAAQYGADQELEACCEWLKDFPHFIGIEEQLCAARRPKPPSLKEQALEALEVEDDAMPLRSLERSERFDTIRRALEALPND